MTTAHPQDLAQGLHQAPEPTQLALLLLGRGADPRSERGVQCPGQLPPPSENGLVERAKAAKQALGEQIFVLGHHYQRDEVIQFADVTGDSFKLARDAAARPDAAYVVFCGVHFMAESADLLTAPDQAVVLPDLAAGCSMADMADHQQVVEAWDVLMRQLDVIVAPTAGTQLTATNLTGHPAVILPNGFRDDGTPVSLTFLGRLFGEESLLRVAHHYQRATPHHHAHPELG